MLDSGERQRGSVHLFSMHTSPLARPGEGNAGGLNVYVSHLSQALARSGYSVHAFTLATDIRDVPRHHGDPDRADAGRTPVVPGYTVHTIYVPEARDATKEDLADLPDRFGRACARYAADQGLSPDVLHAHYWLSGEAARSYRRALGSGAPLVLTLHTTGEAKNLQSGDGETPEPQRRIDAERALLSTAEATVVNTSDERDQMRSLYGAPEQNLHIIPPGVDISTFHPATAPRAEGNDEFRVVFAGRPQPLKGPEILIDAVALAAADVPDIRLDIRGTAAPEYLDGLKARTRERGISDRCRFLPASGRSELAEAFRAADAVACPSSSETFGLVALEAQACGVPVLASDVSGLRAALDDGAAGLLVPQRTPEAWSRALAELAGDPEARERLSRAGIAHARTLDWDHAAHATAALYDHLIAASEPPAPDAFRYGHHTTQS
ncbi:glycosyltransferase [Curtobacterium sp. S6]|uniref:glycosyltransferase n=1 Tax=Curtobacterium sp. S6 TaxID=1479623 RepID=UPI000A910D5C|nr:glycosyltransferase [Curtobacterium sp. S6]